MKLIVFLYLVFGFGIFIFLFWAYLFWAYLFWLFVLAWCSSTRSKNTWLGLGPLGSLVLGSKSCRLPISEHTRPPSGDASSLCA